jgi:hypothetical protein
VQVLCKCLEKWTELRRTKGDFVMKKEILSGIVLGILKNNKFIKKQPSA